MKKRNIMIGSAVLLAVLLVVGGTMAWFTAETEEVANDFTAGTVEIELVDNFANEVDVNPGDCFERKVTVTNTGTKKAMVRVHESTVLTLDQDADVSVGFEPNIGIVEFEVNDKWEYVPSDNCFYYTEVLLPGTTTEPILEENNICFNGPGMGNEYQGATFTINLQAEAIQATNGAPATEGWKFDPLAAEEEEEE
jgi:predicted ribosomally synthesized peptide with SipW-like signal peptide